VSTPSTAETPRPGINVGLAALGYAALVAYGSLYPFAGGTSSPHPLAFLAHGWSGTQISLGDLGTNLLAYIPFGILAYRFLATRIRPASALCLTIILALALSLTMEVLQAFVPTRVQSYYDLVLNTLGGAGGAIVARLHGGDGRVPAVLRSARSEWIVNGRSADLGLVALGAWFLSRVLPLVPSIDVGKIRFGLAALSRAIVDPRTFDGWHALSEVLTWAGLALIGRSLVRPGRSGALALAVVASAILAAQIVIVGRQLLPEVVVGCGGGLMIAALLGRADVTVRANAAFFLVFAGFCIAENLAVGTGTLHPFTWIPFGVKLDNTLAGIESLLETIGLTAALAWSARTGAGPQAARWLAWGAGLLVGGGALALEIGQRNVPGRTGDVTTPLLVVVMWILAWRHVGSAALVEPLRERATTAQPPGAPTVMPEVLRRVPHGPAVSQYLILMLALAIGIWSIGQLPGVPYNVRELLYAGHPFRSALLLAIALLLTLAIPVLLVTSSLNRRILPVVVLLALNALLTWLVVVNAVASESIHDIVGSPVLHWPGQTETCLRFVALHAAITLLVTGGAIVASVFLQSGRAGLLVRWAAAMAILGPLLHWVIVSRAATDNLTELMLDGGSPVASVLLALAMLLSFAAGSLLAASVASRRRRAIATGVAVVLSLAVYPLVVAGTNPSITKYGKVFSALQFLLSADRTRYATEGDLVVRYLVAYGLLIGTTALLQYRTWAAAGASAQRRNADSPAGSTDRKVVERN
jgi:VanZ family protein